MELNFIKNHTIKSFTLVLVYILLATFFFERIPSLETAFGPIRLFTVLVPLLIIVLLSSVNKIKHNFRFYSLQYLPVIFLVLALFANFNIVNLPRFISASIGLMLCIGSCVIISSYKWNWEKALKLLCYGFYGQIIFSIFQFVGDKVFKLSENITGVKPMFQSNVFGIPRLHTTYNEPAYFANALFLGIFLFAALMCSEINIFTKNFKNYKLVYFFTLISLISIFVLTLAKSAWLILPFPLIVFLIFVYAKLDSPKFKKIFNFALFATLGFVLIFGSINYNIVGPIAGQFLDTVAGESATSIERNSYKEAGFELVKRNFPFGVGLGQFGTVGEDYIVDNLFGNNNPSSYNYFLYKPLENYRNVSDQDKVILFNVHLEILVEYGLLALIVFLLLIGLLLYKTLKRIMYISFKIDSRNVLVISLAFYILCSLGQFFFISPVYINPFWVALGLLMATLQQDSKIIN